MNVRYLLLTLFFALLCINRLAYFIQLCGKYRMEFSDDINFYAEHCTTSADREKLGRRGALCDDIKIKTSYSFITIAFEHLINDTIYREISTRDVIQLTFFVLIFYVLDKVLPSGETRQIPVFLSESDKRSLAKKLL